MTEKVFPGTFADAIASPHVRPGDSLLLTEGTYKGFWDVTVAGDVSGYITIRPYQNARVVIDGGIRFKSSYIKVMDLEITESAEDDHTDHHNNDMSVSNCWLIGCHIHHCKSNGASWFGSGPGGIVECWIHDNGYIDPEGVGRCHGVYTHNHQGGARLLARSLWGNSIGSYAIQIYSGGSNYLKDYTVEDNVIVGDPVICGGGLGLVDYVCQRNVLYSEYWYQGRYSSQPNQRGLIQDNLFIRPAAYSVQHGYIDLVEKNNTVWGGTADWSERPADGYKIEQEPAKWNRFIPFTLSERWAGVQATLADGKFSAAMVSK